MPFFPLGLTTGGPYQPLSGNLTAVSGLSGAGYARRTGVGDAWAIDAFVPTSRGGTGFTSYTQGDIPYGNGSGTLSLLPDPGLPGYVLSAIGGSPSWVQLSTLTATVITGTANQVLVNGTSGSGQTGPVTLTLPQDIDAGATPEWAGLIVGTSNLAFLDPSLNSIGYIKSEASNGGLNGVAAQWFIGTASPSGDCSAILIGRALSGSRAGGAHGVRDESSYAASGFGLYGYASFDSAPVAEGAATYNHIASFQSRIEYTGSGSIPNIQGLTYQPTHSGVGTIGQSIGIFIDDALGSGVITTQIGAYFGQLSRGSNNFSIYSSGTQQSYHEGLWQVGSAGISTVGPTVVGGYFTSAFSAASSGLASFTVPQGLYNYYDSGGVIAAYSTNTGTLASVTVDCSSFIVRLLGTPSATISSTGLTLAGTVKTAAPSGGTAHPWKLGNYTSGAAAQAGKVRVEINGVAYDLLTA